MTRDIGTWLRKNKRRTKEIRCCIVGSARSSCTYINSFFHQQFHSTLACWFLCDNSATTKTTSTEDGRREKRGIYLKSTLCSLSNCWNVLDGTFNKFLAYGYGVCRRTNGGVGTRNINWWFFKWGASGAKRSPCIDFDIGSDISARLRAFSALRTKVKIEISHFGMLRVSPRSVSTFFYSRSIWFVRGIHRSVSFFNRIPIRAATKSLNRLFCNQIEDFFGRAFSITSEGIN